MFLGSAKGMAATAAFTLAGAAGGDALVVQGAGDVNGDGAPDVFVGGVVYLGTGSGFAAQTSFAPGAFAADFVGDNDGDGLTDFASNQAIHPGTPAGIDGNQTLFIQAGESVFATAGDIDGDGYCRYGVVAQRDGGLPRTRARLLRRADRVRLQRLPRLLASVHPRLRLAPGARARSSPRPATSTATAATTWSC